MKKLRIRQLVNLRYDPRKTITWDFDDNHKTPLFFNTQTEKTIIRVSIETNHRGRLTGHPLNLDNWLMPKNKPYTFKKQKAYSQKNILASKIYRQKKIRGKKRKHQIYLDKIAFVNSQRG